MHERYVHVVIVFAFAFLTVTGAVNAQTCAQPPQGMIAWWPGDGSSIDIVDSNPGILQNGAAFAPGLVGSAFSLDGINDYVRIPDNASLRLPVFTIEVWFKPGLPAGPYSNLITKSQLNTATNRNYVVYVYQPAGQVCASSSFLGVQRDICGGPLVNDGQFHHAAYVVSGIDQLLYVDGLLAASGHPGVGADTQAVDVTFGQLVGWSPSLFNGLIDEAAIYNRSLSPSEIFAVYTARGAGKCKRPVAHGGTDQTIDEGAFVQLNGSGTDPLGRPLAYSWTQVAGPSVTLSDASVPGPTFTAPSVLAGGAVASFQIVATTSLGSSDPDVVDVTIRNVNNPPVAETTGDTTVPEQSLVILDGRPSYDEDGEALNYAWTQTAGTLVTLVGDGSASPSFTSPFVGPSGETLTFQLIVNDGTEGSAPALTNVNVTNVNQAPTANAGADVSVPENIQAYLTGSGLDPDGDTLSYRWTQTGGTSVALADPTSPTSGFWTPFVASGGEALTFSLVVSDGFLDSLADNVSITVLNTNDPPSCVTASATLGQLWPPNHKLIEAGVTGVVDPQGDNISIVVTGVTSDEATSGLGDGDSSPDAVIQGDSALLRAERWDQGDGRVYAVHFVATDSNSESCTGIVSVGVPKNARKGATAIDSGQSYDATAP